MSKKVLLSIIVILIIVAFAVVGVDYYLTMPRNVSIVVMDAWETFPWKLEEAESDEAREKVQTWNDWWYGDVQENLENKVVPFLTWARENDITIVFSNMVNEGWDNSLNPILRQEIYNEPIINLASDLDAYLEAREVKTIYYVGYATNNCVWGKPTGMKAMSELGYKVILVEDCSLSGAYQNWTHEETLAHIMEIGGITTSEEVIARYSE